MTSGTPADREIPILSLGKSSWQALTNRRSVSLACLHTILAGHSNPDICSCPLQQVQTIRMTRRTVVTRQAAAASARQRQLTTTTTRLRCASLALPLPALLHPTCFIARDLLGASQAEPCKQPYEERVAELQKEVNSLKEQLEEAQRSAKHWQKEAEKWNSKLNNMQWERLTKWCRSDSGDSHSD